VLPAEIIGNNNNKNNILLLAVDVYGTFPRSLRRPYHGVHTYDVVIAVYEHEKSQLTTRRIVILYVHESEYILYGRRAVSSPAARVL